MKQIKNQNKNVFLKKYYEIIMYLVFGVLTTVVNWTVYILLILSDRADVTLANGIAWFLAVLFAFATNKRFVFDSRSWKAPVLLYEFFAFFGARILSGVVEIFLPSLLMEIGLNQEVLGIKGFMAKLAASVIVIVLNYIFSKLFIFRKKPL